MIVRVVRSSERAAVALGVTALASATFAALLVDDVLFGTTRLPLPSDPGGMTLLATMYAAAAFGPWLRQGSVGSVKRVTFDDEGVRFGASRVARGDVRAVQSAAGAVGTSLCVTTTRRRFFVEVEDRGDAARLALALGGVTGGDRSAVASGIPHAQGVVRGLLVVFAGLHLASDAYGMSSDLKATVALAAGLSCLAATILVVVRAALARRGARFSDAPEGAWTVHEGLHLTAGEADVALDPSAASPARTSTWIAAVDARVASRAPIYRESLPEPDALLACVRDPEASPRERLAAARMLRVGFAVEPSALSAAAASEPEMRARVAAVCAPDPAAAAERLDALGPAFRAH